MSLGSDALDARLEFAAAAAREAGELLLEHARRGVTAERKGRIDLVSQADRDAEALIRRRLADALPDDAIVGEEGAEVAEAEVAGRGRWYVDPLDGTTNFLRGDDRWAVSLGWAGADDVLEIGVVCLPRADELLVARRGTGAWLRSMSGGEPQRRLQVSAAAMLEEAVVASGFPYELYDGPTNLPEWTVVTMQARSMRSLGAAAVELCDVARGRLDAFWEQRLGRWDTAAGIVIAAEAGAVVTDLDGTPLLGPSDDVVVAGPSVHDELLTCLRGSGARRT